MCEPSFSNVNPVSQAAHPGQLKPPRAGQGRAGTDSGRVGSMPYSGSSLRKWTFGDIITQGVAVVLRNKGKSLFETKKRG